MIKETRSLVRLLRAKLHKGLAHQWFLNQYVLKHRLERSVILTKELLYNRDQRTISFKNEETPDGIHIPTSIKKRRNRKFISKYNAENASLVLLKNIQAVGGGWLGTIVVCSTCVVAFRQAWFPPKYMDIDHLHNTIAKFSTDLRTGYETSCKCSGKKLLTACKPIFFEDKKTGKTNLTIGVINNSFLSPHKLSHIETLVRVSGDKFQQVAFANSPFKRGPIPTPPPNFDSFSKTPFGTLIQLMCFWLKNGRSTAQRLIEHHVSPSISQIIPQNLTVRLAPLAMLPEPIQLLLGDRNLRDTIRILVPGGHRITTLSNDGNTRFFNTQRDDAVYTPSRFMEIFELDFFQIVSVRPLNNDPQPATTVDELLEEF